MKTNNLTKSMEITGKVVAVPPVQSGMSARGPWKKATVVVEYEGGQYPKRAVLTNLKDAERFGQLRVGEQYKFYFDMEARESSGKWFQDIKCWKWESLGTASARPSSDNAPI